MARRALGEIMAAVAAFFVGLPILRLAVAHDALPEAACALCLLAIPFRFPRFLRPAGLAFLLLLGAAPALDMRLAGQEGMEDQCFDAWLLLEARRFESLGEAKEAFLRERDFVIGECMRSPGNQVQDDCEESHEERTESESDADKKTGDQ